MQPRTIMTLAVSTGLTVATGVLAVGSNLLPSAASPRPQPVAPVAADAPAVPEQTPTTIVTDYQDVYDPAPAAAPAPDGSAAPDDVDTGQSTAPVVSSDATAPVVSTSDDQGQESESEAPEQEQDHESTGAETDSESQSQLSVSSGRDD